MIWLLIRRLLVAVLLAALPLLGAQLEVGEGLDATAEITAQQYCLGGPPEGINLKERPPDSITIRLTVRLSYRNVSTAPIIFFWVSDVQGVVSRSLNNTEEHREETLIRFRGTRRPYELRDRADLESEQPTAPPFSVLPPGRSWSITDYVDFAVHDPSEHEPDSDLLGKKVFFQLDLNHRFTRRDCT